MFSSLGACRPNINRLPFAETVTCERATVWFSGNGNVTRSSTVREPTPMT